MKNMQITALQRISVSYRTHNLLLIFRLINVEYISNNNVREVCFYEKKIEDFRPYNIFCTKTILSLDTDDINETILRCSWPCISFFFVFSHFLRRSMRKSVCVCYEKFYFSVFFFHHRWFWWHVSLWFVINLNKI